ncbi:hypothetical protein ACQRBN_07350 [Bariatricus sp. SGI.154]|uniref:hypothetical protein n=1 Tax=Bariatricus sp. SGI.154 TaxID=3420549 RepID=UPI003D02A824
MEFYEFDQDNLGKYHFSNKQAKKTLEARIGEICRSIKRAIRLQVILGVIFIVSAVVFLHSLYCAPLYLSILWIFTWSTTMLRMYFCIQGMWKMGVRKEQRKMVFLRIRGLFHVQLMILAWFLVVVGFYCYLDMGVLFVGNILVMGIVLAFIAYALSYMTCSQKYLLWWEFGNDNEGYWILGE